MGKIQQLARRAIQAAIVRYLLRHAGGAFHANAYGPRGVYVALLNEEGYHRLQNPDAHLAAWSFLRPEVRRFAAAMESSLRARENADWRASGPGLLADALCTEAETLFDLTVTAPPPQAKPAGVLDKAAGLATSALQLAICYDALNGHGRVG